MLIISLTLFIVIGAIAGWLAGIIMKSSGLGYMRNIIVGIIGSVIAGLLFYFFGMLVIGLVGSVLAALVGAVILLAILGLIKRK